MAIEIKNLEELMNISTSLLRLNTKFKNVDKGSVSRTLLRAVNQNIYDVYDNAREGFNNIFPSTAEGFYLDEIGALVGQTRSSGTYASDYSGTNFRFYTPKGETLKELIQKQLNLGIITTVPAGFNITIPAGTIIRSTEPGLTDIRYTLVDDIFWASSESEVYGSIIAGVPGPSQNVGPGVLNNHNYAVYPILCENKYGIDNGLVDEEDESFRVKIVNHKNTAATSNHDSILRAASSVPGVQNVEIIYNKPSIGQMTIFIDSVSVEVSDGLLIAVRQAVERVSPPTTNIIVERPEIMNIDIMARLIFKRNTEINAISDIVDNVQISMTKYVNNIPRGDSLIIDQLRLSALNASENISSINIQNLLINNKPHLIRNYHFERDEKPKANIIDITNI